MKKTLANEIAKHLKEVAKNTTDATAFVVNINESIQQDDYYVELLPDAKRRFKSLKYSGALSTFHHIREIADIERYHKVLAHITATEDWYDGEFGSKTTYKIFKVQLF